MMSSAADDEAERRLTPPPSSDDQHRLHLLEVAGKLQCSLHLQRFQLIETAEDPVQWANRVRRQWGGATPTLSLRVTLGTTVVGLTPPQSIDFNGIKGAAGSNGANSSFTASSHTATSTSQAWRRGGSGLEQPHSSFVGINWASLGGGVSLELPGLSPSNAVLTLEVLNFATVPPTLSGICVIHAAALSTLATSKPGPFTSRRPTLSQRFAVHCFPNGNATARDKDTTTHAVLMVELRIVSLAAAALARDVTGGRSGPPSRQISRTNSFSGNLEDASFSGSHAPNNGSMAGVPAGFDPLLSQNRNISGGAVSNVSLTSAAAQSLSALDFNFGAVRLSTTSLYFPTTFLTACGSFVVSNVLCVMNSTESSIISLRVVVSERNGGCMAALAPEVAARNRARSVSPSSNAASAEGITTCKDLLLVHPREAVTLRPQQRAFFSITWGVGKRPISTQSLQHNVAVQLQMQRSSNEPSIPPIDLELHCAQPQPDEMHRPFHYWVNTTMVSNRTLHEELELPYVRSVLPVFLLLQKLEAATTGGGARSPDGPASSRGGATEGEDESMFIRDKDKGALVMVRGGGHAKTTPGSSFAGLGPASPAALGAAVGGSGTETSGRQLQPWEVRLRSRPPKVDIVSGVVRCIIHMGQLRGLPMVVNSSSTLSTTGGSINGNAGGSSNATNAPPSSPRFEESGGSNDFNGSSSQGSAPAFRVSLSPLQRGWSVTRSETTPAYQAQSGALNWVGDTLEALKQPDAVTAQCLRLDLYEVNLADDDAIPIGCALISIPPTPKIPEVMRLPVAFYVYDSYSMYDKLSTTSLLFKDVALEVRPASVVAD